MMRTFISIDVPVNENIDGLLRELKGVEGVKVPPVQQIHLTLKFLGDVDERKVERLCAVLEKALTGEEAFDLTVEGIGAFPNTKRPSVIWMGVKDPDRLMHIAAIVNASVKGLNIGCDGRPFSPHITVGRVNGRADLDSVFKGYREKRFCSITCDHVDVMKSVLTPKGAIHSVFGRMPLRP